MRTARTLALLALFARTLAACAAPQVAEPNYNTAETARIGPPPTFPAPAVVLVEPPASADPERLCDGFDGFVRVTPRPCWQHGYRRHDGPPPLAVIVVDGPTEGRYPPQRLCALRGVRFAIPASLTCRSVDEAAVYAEPEAVERAAAYGGYAPPVGGSAGSVYVHGYTRRDGTYVHGYTRRR
jgi:hypothetical protein